MGRTLPWERWKFPWELLSVPILSIDSLRSADVVKEHTFELEGTTSGELQLELLIKEANKIVVGEEFTGNDSSKEEPKRMKIKRGALSVRVLEAKGLVSSGSGWILSCLC